MRGSVSREPYRIHGLSRHTLGQNIHDRLGFMYGVGLESPQPFWAPWTEHACPPSDVMLAQKLLIETDERRFLRVACRTRIKQP